MEEDSVDAGWIWSRYGTRLMDNESDPEGAESAYRKGEEIAKALAGRVREVHGRRVVDIHSLHTAPV
ncbi:MAG: hypothetical protein CL724_02755 [Chloroflexi bacterium]|nr:hypothetical protein [Chloroflexota bacterium]